MNNSSGMQCLNPCFNGRYSQSYVNGKVCKVYDVLILVLMEDTLRVIAQLRDDENASFVLILVLMEDTLRVGFRNSICF